MEGFLSVHLREAALLKGLTPALLVTGLPRAVDEAARALGVQPAAFYPMDNEALQADFELPEASSWRIWPETGHAMWIGGSPSTAKPPVAWNWKRCRVDLRSAVDGLGAQGLWLQNAALETGGRWTDVLPATAALHQMTSDVTGLVGMWSDVDGQAIKAAVFGDGEIWAETPAEAEYLLAAAVGFADSTDLS